jgi:hypothetical protein
VTAAGSRSDWPHPDAECCPPAAGAVRVTATSAVRVWNCLKIRSASESYRVSFASLCERLQSHVSSRRVHVVSRQPSPSRVPTAATNEVVLRERATLRVTAEVHPLVSSPVSGAAASSPSSPRRVAARGSAAELVSLRRHPSQQRAIKQAADQAQDEETDQGRATTTSD